MTIEHIGDFLICRFDSSDILDTSKYWTPERIESAQPAILRCTSSLDDTKVAVDKLKISDANLSVLPYKCCGKLMYLSPSNGSMYGTAQFLGDDNVALSAAHCIYDVDSKEWCNNFKFLRAYKNEEQSQSLSVIATAVRADWVNGTGLNVKKDYGFIVTEKKSNAGHLDYSLELPNNATSIGYPGNYDNGKVMKTVSGAICNIGGNVVQMDGNPMGAGFSGGAWTDSQNRVIGLGVVYETSYKYVQSPLLTADFKSLYDFVVENK